MGTLGVACPGRGPHGRSRKSLCAAREGPRPQAQSRARAAGRAPPHTKGRRQAWWCPEVGTEGPGREMTARAAAVPSSQGAPSPSSGFSPGALGPGRCEVSLALDPTSQQAGGHRPGQASGRQRLCPQPAFSLSRRSASLPSGGCVRWNSSSRSLRTGQRLPRGGPAPPPPSCPARAPPGPTHTFSRALRPHSRHGGLWVQKLL